MASCDPFSIDFSGSAPELFNKISSLIHQHGGSISGDSSGGTFSVPIPVFGTVAGTYSVSGQTCTIHITQRSFFLPCTTIESFIRENIPTVERTALTTLVAIMASCDPFSIDFSGSAQDLFNKISILIHQHDGTIAGNSSSGMFSAPVPVFGEVEGTYSVSGQTCTINITKRSFFLPCTSIETFIRENIPAVERTAITDF